MLSVQTERTRIGKIETGLLVFGATEHLVLTVSSYVFSAYLLS